MHDPSRGPAHPHSAAGPAARGQPGTPPPTVRRVQSAERNTRLDGRGARPPVGAAVRDGATEAALNVAGVLRDLWADFRGSEKWFKYKAAILGAWLLLSAAGFAVACPGELGPKNNIGARLVRTHVLDTPVFMIVNDSGEPWEDVVVVVNDTYQASVRRVSADHPDNNLTLEPRKLLGEGGAPAPGDLEVTKLQVRTSEGRADLIVDGRAVE
jgi:hypothetical protein